MASYRITWTGDDATIAVCRVQLDPAVAPDVAHETELMDAMCAGLRATSTFGTYSYHREDV